MSSDKGVGLKNSRDTPTILKGSSSLTSGQTTRLRLDSKSKPGPRLGPSALTSHKSNGSKPIGSGPRPTSKMVKSKVAEDQGLAPDDDTHLRLLEWAKRLGFMPKGKFTKTCDYPSAEEMKKLCRRDTVPVWQHMMRCVRPREEVAVIRGALAERRRRQAGDIGDGLAPTGHPATRETKLAERRFAAAGAEERLERLMADCRDNVLKLETLSHRTEQDRLRAHLLQRRAESLSQDVAQTDKYTAVVGLLLDELGRRGAGTGQEVASSLRKCLPLFEELHQKSYETSATALSHEEKRRLHEATEGRTSALTAAEIHRAMGLLGDELCRQTREALAGLLTREEEDGQAEVAHAELQLRRVEAMYVQLVAEARATEEENASLEATGEESFQRCRDLLLEKLTPSDTDPDRSEDSCLADAWLEKKVACARLEASIGELERVVREMREDSERMERSNREWGAALERGGDKSRALGRRIAHMTALGDHLTSSVQTTVTATLAALGDPSLGKTVERAAALIARSRGGAGREVGAFCRLPMDAMDCVQLPSGEKIPRSDLLINYVQRLPRLPSGRDATDLCGAPMSTIDDVVVNLHEKKLYGGRLRWALEDRRPLFTKPVYDAAQSRAKQREISAVTRSLLDRLRYQSKICEAAIEGFRLSFDNYVDHPIQLALADDVPTRGLSFQQWRRRFDDVYERLVES